MSNEKYNQIMMEAYRQYSEKSARKLFKSNTYQEFIDKCKTDSKFSENWGLKIEEIELSLEERNDYYTSNYKGLDCESHEELNKLGDIPTKLITVTYKDEKIEVYE